jgi:hypothetical protein
MSKTQNKDGFCEWPYCRNPRQITYYERGLCNGCFSGHDMRELKRVLKIKDHLAEEKDAESEQRQESP